MAPRKKSQNPSDETPDVTTDESVTATTGDDTVPPADIQTEVEAETLADAGDDTLNTEEVSADSPPEISDDTLPDEPADSIELPEPDSDEGSDSLSSTEADDSLEASETTVDDTPTETSAESAPPPPAAPPARRGGFFPLMLGGVVAGAAGFFAATYMDSGTDLTSRFDAQDRAIAEIRAAIPAAPDTSGIEAATGTNATAISDLGARVEDLATQITALSDRMDELEKAPLENAVSDTAMKAYEDELARLQAAMQAQREEVETMVTQAQQMSAAADAQTARTEARAALTAIMAALDSGDSYSESLTALQKTGQQVPEPLVAHADGIASLADLRDDFPAAARNALEVTRGAGNSSVGDFFKTQLGVRSLEPKEGSDPDAVLSRAEAAVADNDLAKALEEIATLPPEAQAELADWTAAAETRLKTVQAAQGLMADLNSN